LFYRFKSLEKMKKLVLMFVAVAAISFASCGNKTQQAEAVDSDSIAVVDSADSVVADSAAVDSAATDSVK
jgi:nucleoside 2-deoxyribosyltransferase